MVRRLRFVFLSALIVLLGCITLQVLVHPDASTSQPVRRAGLVLPHHQLVSDKIESAWADAASEFRPDHIVLIGPNHEDRGRWNVAMPSSANAVDVRLDMDAARVVSSVAAQDDSAFVREHSIALHAAYLNTYFPDVPVLPIVLRSTTTAAEVEQVVAALRGLSGNVLVVASVDFSHYLSLEQAMYNDRTTWEILRSFDYARLHTLDAGHVDSDQSLAVMMKSVCEDAACSWDVRWQGNSAEWPNTDPRVTTSYSVAFLHQR